MLYLWERAGVSVITDDEEPVSFILKNSAMPRSANNHLYYNGESAVCFDWKRLIEAYILLYILKVRSEKIISVEAVVGTVR